MINPYLALQQAGQPQLANLGWHHLQSSTHGDLQRWQESVNSMPVCAPGADLDRAAPALGQPTDNSRQLQKSLFDLHPWRKGPLLLGGIEIDSEWRSDWKWDRIAPQLDLDGHQVLDIGCGNGYFGLRMLGSGADLVVGIDPTMVFVMQWLAMQKLAPDLRNFVLPMGIEHLPGNTATFDSVFSMGVLYHRRDPLKHLDQLKTLTRPGGQIILETLILEGNDNHTLHPEGRYARMRNVHAIPTLGVLQDWLRQASLPNAKVLDISKTTPNEQRSTEWMTFESLKESLNKDNPSLTIESHPAPVRAALLIKL